MGGGLAKAAQTVREIIHHKARERKRKMKKEEFNQIKYQNEFKRKNYDRFELVMPKGQKEIIKQKAMAEGQSISEYINTAILERMAKN